MERGAPETERQDVRFVALLSILCRRYKWRHDFYKRTRSGDGMGLREFRTWCEQVVFENEQERQQSDSWEGSKNDPGWQAMRAKRDRARGR
jgi:hypothetical protein